MLVWRSSVSGRIGVKLREEEKAGEGESKVIFHHTIRQLGNLPTTYILIFFINHPLWNWLYSVKLVFFGGCMASQAYLTGHKTRQEGCQNRISPRRFFFIHCLPSKITAAGLDRFSIYLGPLTKTTCNLPFSRTEQPKLGNLFKFGGIGLRSGTRWGVFC